MIAEDDGFDPEKIYDNLIKGCQEAKLWLVKCYVDESFIFNGKFPFPIIIVDGVYYCRVIAPSMIDAMKVVCDFMPVIKFVNDENE
jgi:hypothetical protein